MSVLNPTEFTRTARVSQTSRGPLASGMNRQVRRAGACTLERKMSRGVFEGGLKTNPELDCHAPKCTTHTQRQDGHRHLFGQSTRERGVRNLGLLIEVMGCWGLMVRRCGW